MKYFTIDELCASNTARVKKIDNSPSKPVRERLEQLVDNILDPLREKYGKPINVNSGYRCNELNKLVGGVTNSEHKKGSAADIVGTPNTHDENKKLFNLIDEMNLPFRQLIWEHGGDWVHVSYDPDDVKRQKLNL